MEKLVKEQTWWIGGYIELVHTGHSSNSWTLVAGAMTVEPIELLLLAPPLRGFVEENSEWWWLGWISSSSMPSEDDTHSTLSKSIDTHQNKNPSTPVKVKRRKEKHPLIKIQNFTELITWIFRVPLFNLLPSILSLFVSKEKEEEKENRRWSWIGKWTNARTPIKPNTVLVNNRFFSSLSLSTLLWRQRERKWTVNFTN